MLKERYKSFGIEIKKQEDGSITLIKPQLIIFINKDLYLQHNTKTKSMLALSMSLLHEDGDSPDMSPEYHYGSIIRKLNFLEKSTRVDLSYSVHQCAHISKSPKELDTCAMKRTGCYLLGTKDKDIIL